MDNSSNSVGETEYRAKAVTRLNTVPELRQFRHFGNSKWSNCEFFLGMVERYPVHEVLKMSCNQGHNSIRRVAVYEAGHAVADYLTGLQVDSVEVALDYKNGKAGYVSSTGEVINPESDLIYKGWRYIFAILAGSVPEDKFMNGVSQGFDHDLRDAIALHQTLFQTEGYMEWVGITLIAISRFVNGPSILKSIEQLSKRLLVKGVIDGNEVAEIVSRPMKHSGNVPEIVYFFERWNSVLMDEKREIEQNNNSTHYEFHKRMNDLFTEEIKDLCCNQVIEKSQFLNLYADKLYLSSM